MPNNNKAIRDFVDKTLSPGMTCHLSGTKIRIWASTPRILKSGKKSIRFFDTTYTEATPLFQCDFCKKISTPKKVQYKYTLEFSYLCCGCWNKLRVIEKKQNQIEEIMKITRKLRRLSTNKRVKNEKI